MPIDLSRRDEPHMPLVFMLAIGQRTADGSYPLDVRLSGPDSHQFDTPRFALRFPERLVRRARSLLQPQSQFQGGDEHLMGSFLGQQLFVPPVRRLLLQSIAQAREANTGLRIALRIEPAELTTLPWEWLTLAGRSEWSPALLDDYGFVRLAGAGAATPVENKPRRWSLFRRSETPLLLLVAPSERDAVLLAIERAIRPIVASQTLRYEVLIAPTARALRRTVNKERPDILHVLARAEFDRPDDPQLFLDEPLDTDACVDILGDARPLVVLDGSWRATGALAAASNRLAYALVERLLPAAIAFHSPLSPNGSATFAQGLYEALASGQTVHEAMIAARQSLAAHQQASWGLPIFVQREGVLASGEPGMAVSTLYKFALPLLAGAVGVAAASYSVTRAEPEKVRPPLVPTALVAAASSPVAEGGRIFPFTIALPTPTFVPAVPSPTLGLPTSEPAPPQPTALPGPLGAPARWATYVVQPNDTVAQIAQRMGSDEGAISALNRLDPAAPLIPGRGLMIPVYGQGEAGIDKLDVNRGRQDLPLVALTFDTEINDVMAYQICDILRERGVHATFFVTGRWVSAYPDAARALVANGHELGNHSLTHPNFTAIGLDGAASELDRTEEIVVATTGVSTHPFFRFPYGAKNERVLQVIASKGYISYHWTADDTNLSYWLASTATNPRSGYGAILLLHQRPSSIAALPVWLDQLAQMGLTPVPLSQILR